MNANDAPILDAALIAALRDDLEEAGWTVDALEEILSDRARAALAREQRLPALIELEGRDDPASVLTRLFVLGNVESEADLAAALPRLGGRGARALGLV
ncbi:MAG: SAM-dependent methyltransferase, partial [Schaalia hyovaginalis]|nr:SAM-dependent methyltransferase [Schaalia hyovaginalis]